MKSPAPAVVAIRRPTVRNAAATVALALAASLHPSMAKAQTATGGTNEDTSRLEEVVITATPLRRAALATAQPVAVLRGDDLVTAITSSLGETLADQPGMSATSFGPIASRPIVRGQGGLRVQTYVDGADTLDVGALSDDHAVTVEPLLAEQIEIVRGPAALLFGSSAAAGAVNVITGRLPLARPDAPMGGELQARGDTAANGRGIAARISGSSGDHLQYTADLHHVRAGDLRIPGGRLDNSAGETRGGNIGLGWVGERGSLAIAINELRSAYGLPGGHDHAESAETTVPEDPGHEDHEDVTLSLDQRRIDLAGEWRLGGFADAIRLRVARNDYRHRELEGEAIGTFYGQLGTEARLSIDRDERWTIGAQWREVDFNADGEEAFLPTSRTRNLGAFAFGELKLGTLTLEAGARLERQDIDVVKPAPLAPAKPPRSHAGDTKNISLGLLWPVTAPWTATLQLTSSERHPTATELFAFGPHIAAQRFEIGDESLRVERGLTADLVLRRQAASGWTGSIGAFVSDYGRFITALPGGAALPAEALAEGLRAVRFTAVDARFSGIELDWRHDQLLHTAAGIVGLRVFGDLVRARDAAGEPLPQIPPRRLGVETSLVRNPLRLSLQTVWNDAQRDVAAGETTTAGFTAVDLEIAYRWRTGGADMLWFARGANLLDEQMRRHASPLKDVAPLAARHIVVGMQVGF
jgi:iron complex outermembrane receptor protein